MRRTLSLILSVIMILSLAVIGISAAPEGTAISSLDDLKAMKADGKYYLTKDIDATGFTYPDVFTGTFDGDGYTVTVSQALFADLSGTVKNLCLRGEISGDADIAALALTSTNGLTLVNVVNCANVTSTLETFTSGYDAVPSAAGLVSKVFGVSTFTDCVNYGKISGRLNCAGILTYGNNVDVTFTNCVNAGEINTLDVKARTGGIMAVGGKQSAAYPTITFDSCKNYATVIGGDQVGGMIGWAMGPVVCKNCVNTGDVTSTLNYAAGIVCRVGDDSSKKKSGLTFAEFTGCVNTGYITSNAGQAGGIGAYIVFPANFTDCVNSGYVKCDFPKADTGVPQGTAGGILGKGAVDAGTATYTIDGCYNFGTVDAGQNGGGFIGYLGYKGNKATAPYTIKNSANHGDVYGYTNYVGGFVSYVYGDPGNNQYMDIQNCITTGKLTGNQFISEFIGYGNTDTNVIKDCIGASEIVIPEGKTPYTVIWGCSSKLCTEAPNLSGTVIVDGGKTEWFTYSTGTEANRLPFSTLTEAQIKRVDSVADAQLNPAYTVSLKKTATDAAAAAAEFMANAAKIVAGQSPFRADEPVTPPTTGDNLVWVVFTAAVAALGAAVVIRKKISD